MKYDDIDIFENDIKGYSLGGSVSEDMRKLQGRPESEDLFTPAQASWFLSQLPPGTGLLDISRGTPAMPSSEADPSEFYSGELQGTLAENLARGNNLESAFQILGGLGDLAYGIPVAGVVAGPALKGLSVAGRAGLKSLRSGDGKLIENLQPEDISTGQPVKFKYSKNKEQAPQMGATYAQDVEPSGRYMISGKVDQEGWETGVQEFNNPLVLDWGKGSYQDSDNWKQVLSANYGGRTGSDLSDAIKADGYDGIITVINTKTSGGPQVSEIVDLKNQGGIKSLTAADEPLRAYHSSPFEFDEFQLEKIGTGEGNQAFGYGLHFGEAPETGKFYRDMFDNKTGGIFFGAKKVDSDLGDEIVGYDDVDFEKGFPELFYEVDGNPDQQLDRIQDLLDDYLGVDPEIVDTSMYQEGSANLLKLTDELEKKYPDEDVVYRLREDLEYDLGIPRDEIDALEDMSYEFKKNKKALNEILAEMDSINRYSIFRSGTADAEDVAKEIDGMARSYTGRQKRLFDFHVKPRIQIKEGSAKTYEVDLDVEKEKLIDWDTPLNEQSEFVQDAVKKVWREAVEDPEVKKMLDGLDEYNMQQTGENQYETLARRLGSPKQLSEALDKQGVKGIQYADGFTRDKGGVSKNFVIFDPRVIDISKRYGVPIAIAGGMLMKMDQAKEELDTNNVDIFN